MTGLLIRWRLAEFRNEGVVNVRRDFQSRSRAPSLYKFTVLHGYGAKAHSFARTTNGNGLPL